MKNVRVVQDHYDRTLFVGLAFKAYKRVNGQWVLYGVRTGTQAGPKGRLP